MPRQPVYPVYLPRAMSRTRSTVKPAPALRLAAWLHLMLTSTWLPLEKRERNHSEPLRDAVKKTRADQTVPLAPEDVGLFRSAIGAVTPLQQDNRIITSKPPRKPVFDQPEITSHVADILSDHYPEETQKEFLSNGISRATIRKLRHGLWPIQDRLDLHGLTSDGARIILQRFLLKATQHQFRCVLVVHGKGLNSRGGEAVLRKRARHWLTQHSAVLGFCDASPKDGGSGAVLVLLKASS